jgi:phospholipid transport system substrate-binding protein
MPCNIFRRPGGSDRCRTIGSAGIALTRSGCFPMPSSRRRMIHLLATGAVIAAASRAYSAVAQVLMTPADATRFIQQAGDKMAAVLNQPGDWPSKRHQVETLISETVDVSGVTQFALGRFWRTASEEQRSECVRLFSGVLLGSVGRAVGAYRGVTFTVGRSLQVDNNVQVWTMLFRPGDPPREVIWIIGPINGVPRVVDIVAEGTSMRITERDDTTSFLARNNYSIPALIETLRQRAEPIS